MKNFDKFAIVLASTVFFGGTAHAQSFDGPMVGAQAGWQDSKLRNPKLDVGTAPIDASHDTGTLGAFVGYDKRFGLVVLGGEASLNFATSGAIDRTTGTSRIQIDPKHAIDLTSRVGYLVTPETLVYARGGYTNERIRATLTTASGTTQAAEGRDGWLAGAGVERMVLPHLSARVEYRYADLSQGDGKYDRHQLLTGIAWHF